MEINNKKYACLCVLVKSNKAFSACRCFSDLQGQLAEVTRLTSCLTLQVQGQEGQRQGDDESLSSAVSFLPQ